MREPARESLMPPTRRSARGATVILLATAIALTAGVVIFANQGRPPTVAGNATPSASASASLIDTGAVSSSLSPTATAGGSRERSSDPSPSLVPRADGELQLVIGGDVMLARTIGDHIKSVGPEWPFAKLGTTLRDADVALVNFECTLGNRGTPEPKHYRFRAPSAAAETLRLAGIDAVSQANNHALDYGRPAFAQAQQLLAAQDIGVAGAGKDRAAAHSPVILERNGVSIAILAYADVPTEVGGFNHQGWIATAHRSGIAWVEIAALKSDVRAARKLADHVIVFFHFGFENRTTPTAAQKRQAHAAIDAGASLVVGAHPHVLQGTERYKGGLIAYSLGNFVFDGGGWARINRDSAMLEVTFTPDSLDSFDWHPVVVDPDGRPRPANASEARRIMRRVTPIG